MDVLTPRTLDEALRAKAEQFDTVLAEGANIIHLQSAVPSKAVRLRETA
jgi:hypothetical protein